MGITDLFRPKHRHSNVRVRTEAVKALTRDDAATLLQIAKTDRDIGVRRLAIEKIDEADVLAQLAAGESERSLRDYAGGRAAELWSRTACGDDAEAAGAALTGIVKLGDQHALVEIAAHADLPALRKRAFGELRDPRALAELAKGDGAQDVRLAAVGRIDDGDVLRALAIDTTTKEIGLAAVDKLDDADRLDNIAQKAKNKAVRTRARKIVGEIREAERAKQISKVPDEVKRKRAEAAQLVREVEAVAESFDFEKHAPKVRAAQAAWKELGIEGHQAMKFVKMVDRFWKRKELFEQQARSADELRAVQREAEAEKARAHAAKAAADKAAAEQVVEPSAAKPEDAAAKAEAAAAREAEKARRAAELAEREAKSKEAAERGAQIAASLAAMCDDMEKLAASDPKTTRDIDRLLQQAQKAFEQIGKAQGADRDALSERYTVARGKLVVRASELREGEDWARFANVPKAEALIATAKEILAAPPTRDLGDKLRQLQALWKEVGPMPQRRSKELWDQFKTVCDQIYDVVKGQRALDGEKFAEATKVKEALIAEVESIVTVFDSENALPAAWQATAEQLKQLQAKWKDSGHLPRKQGDELWKRFRAACDRFFERRKPLLDARHAEEGENLAKKQALIARAQAVAEAAPGAGGWGKAIGEIKELQLQWKDIGWVPRRDADAVYKAFRTACDSLFAKRDGARDAEADQHREKIEEIKFEIADVIAGEGDVVARALAVREAARELRSKELDTAVTRMIQHVIAAHADAIAGTELDPAVLRARRDKLIAKAEEIVPKQPQGVSAEASPADIAAKLAAAMKSNAFGELRFSGRDPVEVIEELRGWWAEAGPIATDEDRAQAERFEAACAKALAATSGGRDAQAQAPARRDDDERGEGRRRRERRSREERPPIAPQGVVVQSTHDAITQPAALPYQPREAPVVPAPVVPPVAAAAASPAAPSPAAEPQGAAEPARAKSATMTPEDVDTGWDIGEDDPTATAEPSPPSSSEMAGDSATGGDGIDEPGWD